LEPAELNDDVEAVTRGAGIWWESHTR